MKNAMKKLMAFALVAVMLVAALPFQAFAAEVTCKVDVILEDTGKTYAKSFSVSEEEGSFSLTDDLAIEKGLMKSDKEVIGWFCADGTTPASSLSYSGLSKAGDDFKIVLKVRTKEEPEEEPEEPKEEPEEEPEEPKEEVKEPITLVVKNGDDVIDTVTKTPNGSSALVKDMLTYWFNKNWEGAYTFSNAYNMTTKEAASLNSAVAAGQEVHVRLYEVEEEEEKEPEVQQPSNDGNANTNPNTNSGQVNSSYNKFPYNVYLNIYNDTKLGSAEKVIKINDTAAEDGKVTLKEVKSIVKKYYNAIDSDTGIKYDGLYLAMGNWSNDYIWDVKDDVIDDIDEMRNQSTVYINVMIDNAKLASSSTADSSNPKTGDNIFMAVSVMTLSASALAVFFFLNKKRAL